MISTSDQSPIGREALDTRTCDTDVARATLLDIARSNRWFGGIAAVCHGVATLMPASRGNFTVLDVGAGMGDVGVALCRRLGTRTLQLTILTVDWHREAARLCASQGLASGVADAAALPFADESVDIAVASQLLHHYTRDAAVRLIREMLRVTRCGVVVADLRRSRLAMAGIWFASRLLRFHPASQHDGVLSVKRGFTRKELLGLFASAGMTATVEARPGFRLVVTIPRIGAGTGGADHTVTANAHR